MDAYEATRIVFSRIQSLEPENVSKIMGYMLIQDNGDQEMIRLAFAPDVVLQSFITKAKKDLGLIPMYKSNFPLQISQLSSQINGSSLTSSPSRPAFHPHGGLYWAEPPQSSLPIPLEHSSNYLNYRPAPTYHHEISLFSESSSASSNSHNIFPSASDFLYPDMAGYGGNSKLGVSLDQISSISNGDIRAAASDAIVADTVPAVWKPCVYFARGYCKHGSNCRFLHGYTRSENNSTTASSLSSPTETRSLDEAVFHSGSLERLEVELQELLKVKRMPISIAALPQLYFERFGKNLQAEGYLTESQRHGKAGYSLTKLLARLKNTVTLIDRPHGQHAVVLVEDAQKYMAYRSATDDLGGMNSGSRQIYLTFPAESTFTEEDVREYFDTFGHVQDVRIPYQQKRMFGFVTFMLPETVKIILAKGNPHYVCGARVLVKPYREKGKITDRKLGERVEQPKYLPAISFDANNYDQMNFGLRMFDNSDIIRRHMEEQEQTIELERRRLAGFHLAAAEAQRMQQQIAQSQASIAAATNPSTTTLVSHALQRNQTSNGVVHSEEETKTVEDLISFPSADHFGYLLEVLETNEDDQPTHESKEDQGSYGHNLPENPFANITGSNGNGTLHNSEETKNLTSESMALILKGQASSTIDKELTCSMCLDALVDPKPLDCNHVFCLKCLPKVGEMSNFEQCPICSQYKGKQLIKLPVGRDLQDILGKIAIPTSSVW